MDNLIRKLVYYLAILGTLYHIYLVIHPYTPFSGLHLSILDLTQVQRATHVFLVALLGYLISYTRLKNREFTGGLILAMLTALILFEFVKLDIPVSLKAFAVVIWAVTMLPPLIPPVQKFSNIACSILCFLPFIYLVVNYDKLIYRAIIPEPWDLLMAFSEMLLVLGVIFRMSGPIMPIFVVFFFLYNIFGNRIPGVFASPGFDLDMLLGKMYCETEAGISEPSPASP